MCAPQPQHAQLVAQQQQFRVALAVWLPNQEQVDKEAEANLQAGQEHERRGWLGSRGRAAGRS